MTAEELLAFEEDIAREFEAGHIHAPVHLAGGNQSQLIEYFSKYVQPHDWIFTGWRNHFHALLKGVPSAEVKQAILDGRSISLCFPEHRMFSSGIVGGIAPIALGVAQSLYWRERGTFNQYSTVHVFLGDMSERSGIVRECMDYAAGHRLPIIFVIEDNGMSICSPTQETWGEPNFYPGVHRYSYKMERPHVGVGRWVKF